MNPGKLEDLTNLSEELRRWLETLWVEAKQCIPDKEILQGILIMTIKRTNQRKIKLEMRRQILAGGL